MRAWENEIAELNKRNRRQLLRLEELQDACAQLHEHNLDLERRLDLALSLLGPEELVMYEQAIVVFDTV